MNEERILVQTLAIRPVQEIDSHKLANLIHFGQFIHRHLDWISPLEWINHQPYLLAELEGKPIAVLACPPDPPKVSWIRLFAVSKASFLGTSWNQLWSSALQQLMDQQVEQVVAIPLQGWFSSLLMKCDFKVTNQVVILVWEKTRLPPLSKRTEMNIRPMNFDDLSTVHEIDTYAFEHTWQISYRSLVNAFHQAAIATVAEWENRMVGYQISTSDQYSGHLARLAVLPEFQGMGIGAHLIQDLLEQFVRRGVHRITVNTQKDNERSLSLYIKMGFYLTKESFPVYQYNLLG